MKKLITLSFFVLFLTNNLCSQVEIDTTVERFIFDTTGFYEMFQEQRNRDQEKYEEFQKNRKDSLIIPYKSKGIENIFGSKQSTIQRNSSILNLTDYDDWPSPDEIDKEDSLGYDTTLFKRYYHSKTISSVDLCFGLKVFNSTFYNSISTIGDQFFVNAPVYEIVFAGTGRMVIGSNFGLDKGIPYDGHFSYHLILPAAIMLNDTLKMVMTGSTFSFGFGKDLLYMFSNFDLVVSGGIDIGRIALSYPKYKYMKNPFFNPMLSVQPKVKIKRFVISLRVDCWNDISNTKWKQAFFDKSFDKINYDVKNFRQSGMRFQLGVGFAL